MDIKEKGRFELWTHPIKAVVLSLAGFARLEALGILGGVLGHPAGGGGWPLSLGEYRPGMQLSSQCALTVFPGTPQAKSAPSNMQR